MKVGYIGSVIGIKDSEATRKENTDKSFILKYDSGKPQLVSPATITFGNVTIQTEKALWDTGATISAVAPHIPDGANASASDTGTGKSALGEAKTNICSATVEFPGGIVFNDVELWVYDNLSALNVDVIIGMDIISRGRLVVETVNGIPTFSFSVKP